MNSSESFEDYLETILILSKEKDDVHHIDIARKLGVSQPAVTKAVGHLKERDFVHLDGKHILLTVLGRERAESVYAKHCDIRAFLSLLGAHPSDAEIDACKIEHVISDSTYNAIKHYLNSHNNNHHMD